MNRETEKGETREEPTIVESDRAKERDDNGAKSKENGPIMVRKDDDNSNDEEEASSSEDESKTTSMGSIPDSQPVSLAFSRLKMLQLELILSTILTNTLSLIKQYGFTRIRCLALGSPSESKNAMYQLAYLKELVDVLEISETSLYDPVFNGTDAELFKLLNYTVDETYHPTDQSKTLYFLPHAPLDLTERVLNDEEPLYLLANDLLSHTDRLTKVKLHETYRTISLLVHLHQDDGIVSDFVPVSKKKRNKKLVYQEPKIVYDLLESYFDSIDISRFPVEGWNNSFSDLAFHIITRKHST